jgi:hypothetical protein
VGATLGDVVSVMSQYGEIVHVNIVRDKETGKSRGSSARRPFATGS